MKPTSKRSARGQGLTEVAVVLSVIAIGTGWAVTTYGDAMRSVFGEASDELHGERPCGTSRASTSTAEVNQRTIKNFAQGSVYAGPQGSSWTRPNCAAALGASATF